MVCVPLSLSLSLASASALAAASALALASEIALAMESSTGIVIPGMASLAPGVVVGDRSPTIGLAIISKSIFRKSGNRVDETLAVTSVDISDFIVPILVSRLPIASIN